MAGWQAAGTSAATCTTNAVRIAGESDGSSTVTGVLTLTPNLEGEADGDSTAAADLPCLFTFESYTQNSSTAFATFRGPNFFAGSTRGFGYAYCDLTYESVIVNIAGTTAGSSTAQWNTKTVLLYGEADGYSGYSAYLSSEMVMAGRIWGTSFITATGVRWSPITASASGSDTVSGVVRVRFALAGTLVGSNTCTAALTVV